MILTALPRVWRTIPRSPDWRAPKLVVTSPPYPGVHVLYHRWQVDGRKETAVPFMIANKLDGAGSVSYYTMGDRKYPELKTYFDSIRSTMASVAALADARTVVVQMVAFCEPTWQLPRYLDTMEDAGLTECFLPALKGQRDGRLWRSVPGRRWYSDQRGETPGSNEVVLLHRKAAGAPRAARRPRPSLPSHVHQPDHRHGDATYLFASARVGGVDVLFLPALRCLIHLVEVEGDVRGIFVHLALDVLLGVALRQRTPEVA